MKLDTILEKLKADARYLGNPGNSFNFVAEKWVVMFLNMGGPEKLEAIESYLYNIFSDKNIIKLPLSFILQKPLARLISSRRAPKTREHYRAIGGGSPLLKWSRLAAEGVARNLKTKYANINTLLGMRYTPPFIKEALDSAVKSGCKHI
ncbi:MAG: ferrochelatase, partial [Candidatus Zixiibacteriota bacterium]